MLDSPLNSPMNNRMPLSVRSVDSGYHEPLSVRSVDLDVTSPQSLVPASPAARDRYVDLGHGPSIIPPTSYASLEARGDHDGGYQDMDFSPRSSLDSNPAIEDIERNPINKRTDVGLSDQELVLKTTKELNKLIKKRNIPKDRARQIKQERRTLKNRGYAANCRVKREEEEKSLEKENADLSENIKRNKRKAHEDWRDIEEYEKRIKVLERECAEMKAAGKSEFGIDPEEYAAQNPEPDHGFFEAEEMEIPRQNELAHARNLMLAENGIKLEKI